MRDFANLLPRQVINLIICILFLCSLSYFLYKLYLLYINRIIRVECWFCKSLTSVNVKDENSFLCSSCHQYNGFTESGDYNCDLPAQYDAQFNSQVFAVHSNSVRGRTTKSDIFCFTCTQRQAYKIEQLANFEPSNEANWNQELKQFKKELESRCMLCPSCMLKARKRIDMIDMKLIPKVLLWWRSRYQSEPFSIESTDRFRFNYLLPFFSALLRTFTTIVWLYISFPLVLNFFDKQICKSESPSFFKSQCQLIGILKSGSFSNAASSWRFEIACLLGHLSLLSLQTLRNSSNPFLALLDTILFVLSANLIVTGQEIVSSVLPSILILVFVLAASVGVLFFRWLPYAQEDIISQTKKLKAIWPKSDGSPPLSPYFTTPSATVNPMDDASLSLDGLSLNNAPPPHSTIFSPSILSPSSPWLSHVYPNSASPCCPYLRAKNVRNSSASGDFDLGSHFTSVSQVSKRSRRERRRRHRQPKGLLRWTMYLLFGRLETWSDVKAELVCLLNAILVGVLLVLICHLFYIIMSALWIAKV
ncbi:hypothetical protein Aperf_G00000073910 [Anoplocephala perfoliata]